MKSNLKYLILPAIILIFGLGNLVFGQQAIQFWFPDSSNQLQPVDSTWPIYSPDDLIFLDEIKPDGATCANGEILKKTGPDDWDCAADSTGAGGSAIVFDIGDDGGNDSTDVSEIATTGDTNSIFTESSADKILIAVGNNWPNADTADALTGATTNCNAGEYPLGIDVNGDVESCTDATTEINSVVNGLGGTNLTCSGQSCDVDDAFIKLVGDTTGALSVDLNIDANTLVVSYDDNKVGIGTATPNAPLEVKGVKPGVVGGWQSGMLQVTGDGAEFYSSVITGHNSFNGNTQLWYLGSTSSSGNDNIAFINRQNAAIHFNTNNAFRMAIDANGKVGIGDSSPDAMLEITTPTGATNYLMLTNSSDGDILTVDSSGNVGIGVTDPDTQLEILNAGNQLKLSFDGTDNTIFAVDTNGDLTITPSGTQIIVSGNISATNLSGTNTGDNDEVGTLTSGDLCINDGSVVNCTVNLIAELETALDGINVLLETEIDASSELLALMDDETGSASGSPLLVFNTNPTLTGVTLAGIIADNDDMVFEVDADSNGSNKFSWTDGAAGEVMSLTEAGLLAVDAIVGSTGNPVIMGDSQYDRLEMADNGATKTSIAQQNSNNFAIVANGFFDGTWDNYDTSKHTLLHNFLITDPPYFAWSVAQPTAGAPSFTQIMNLTEAGNLQFDGTLTVGAQQWDNGSSLIDGEKIADNTIDVDSLDWGAFTDLGESGIVSWGNITAGELANNSIIDADIDDDGNFTFTGTWNFTGGDIVLSTLSVDAGTYAAASIDGDDINSNIAGRSLTLNAASPDTLDADAELYTDEKGVYIENSALDDTEVFNDLWFFMNTMTITYVWCETDTGTSTINIEDGGDNDILSSDLVCDAGGQTSCSAGCDVNTINGTYDNITGKTEQLDLDILTASSPNNTRVYVGYQIDD